MNNSGLIVQYIHIPIQCHGPHVRHGMLFLSFATADRRQGLLWQMLMQVPGAASFLKGHFHYDPAKSSVYTAAEH